MSMTTDIPHPWDHLTLEQSCHRFFDEVDAIKTPTFSSYYIKHVVEAACGRYVPMEPVLVVAAKRGVPMEHCGNGSPNYMLGLSKLGLRRFIKRHKLRNIG